MIKLGGRVGSVTRTSRLDFGSVPDPDPAYHWATKREMFSLMEVSALSSAALVFTRQPELANR